MNGITNINNACRQKTLRNDIHKDIDKFYQHEINIYKNTPDISKQTNNE